MFRKVLTIFLLMALVSTTDAGIPSGVACTLCLATYWGALAYTAGTAGTVAGSVEAAAGSMYGGTAAVASGSVGGAVALAAALGPCGGVCTAAINPLI